LGSAEQKACFKLLEETKQQIIRDNKRRRSNYIHLIPRRKGDIANPRGGIRYVILDKSF
jgi:hypothetical protein